MPRKTDGEIQPLHLPQKSLQTVGTVNPFPVHQLLTADIPQKQDALRRYMDEDAVPAVGAGNLPEQADAAAQIQRQLSFKGNVRATDLDPARIRVFTPHMRRGELPKPFRVPRYRSSVF